MNAEDHKFSVIEIGTAFGDDLGDLFHPNLSKLVSIDPMYDWVPDVKPEESFNPELVDVGKVDKWRVNAKRHLADIELHLLIGKSRDVASNDDNFELLYGCDILIIDGCHHPFQAVEDDYWLFKKFMAPLHVVLFDDINHGDPGVAFENVCAALEASGELQEKLDVGGYIGGISVKHHI